MSLEATIHTRWAADATLVALIPAARFRTGTLPSVDTDGADMVLPYASLTRVGDAEVRTPSGSVILCDTTMRFTIWAANLSAAKSIADAVEDEYSEAAFSYSTGAVLLMRKTGRTESKDDTGAWTATVDYKVVTQE